MKHHAQGSMALVLAGMWVGIAACDSAAAFDPKPSAGAQGAANVVVAVQTELELAAKVEAEGVIDPASFDLEAVAALVKKGDLESAAALAAIIDDQARFNHIDIDADGKIDHVQLVEVEVDPEAEVLADTVL